MSGQVLLLLGATAMGKTELAMALQDHLGGPSKVRLISVDSAMVYRGMDIGTAKPEPALQIRYPHALIDLCDPAQSYSAADFVRDADQQVREAWLAGQLPLLVGGTMLYAKCFLQGIASLPSADHQMRETLQQEWASRGAQVLHQELQTIDPSAAAAIHPNNTQRLLRALEVVRLSGRGMSEQWQQTSASQRLDAQITTIGLMPDDRVALHQRIATRFAAMLQAGFEDEAAALHARGDLHEQLPSMRAVGYRQAWQYFDRRIDRETFCADAVTATRRLAKRQLTWLRRLPLDHALTGADGLQLLPQALSTLSYH